MGDRSGAQELVDAYQKYGSPVLLTQTVSDDVVSSYGIVDVDNTQNLHRVTQFLEKPRPDETTSRQAVIGKYIITPAMWRYIELSGVSSGGEKRLADGFIRAISAQEEVTAITTQGVRYDAGSKLGYLQAVVDFALARSDIGPAFSEWLKTK